LKCDYLFFTGDLVHKCNYNGVEDFVSNIFGAIGWDQKVVRECAFWAIGNHDISREDSLRNAVLYSIRHADNNVNKFEDNMNNACHDKLTAGGMDDYVTYHQKIFGRKHVTGTSDVHTQYLLPHLNLVVLNTCLTSYDDLDENNLYIIEANLLKVFDNLDNTKPTFVIGHHSTEYFHLTQKTRLKSLFSEKNVDLYLCGHNHQLGCITLHETHDIHQIVCGSGPLNEQLSFSFIHGYYDDTEKRVCLTTYVYSNLNTSSNDCCWQFSNNVSLQLTRGRPSLEGYKRNSSSLPSCDTVPLQDDDEDADGKMIEVLQGVKNRPYKQVIPFPSKSATENYDRSNFSKLSHNLPNRNPFFVGRDDMLEKISAGFKRSSTVVVVGASGLGKSELVFEYAYRHMSEYPYIWLVNASSKSSLERVYRRFAKSTGLRSAETDKFERVLDHVNRWFNEEKKFLFIFDSVGDNSNLDNTEGISNLYDYLPKGQLHGHILINTRNANICIDGVEIKVDVFSQADAVDFLRKRLERINDIRWIDALKVAETLSCLPLALEQAAAYMEINRCSCDHYICQFEKTKKAFGDLIENEYSDKFEKVLAITWKVSIDNMQLTDEARQLFNLCAYFAPDKIPLSLLSKGYTALPQPLQTVFTPGNESNQAKIVNELKKYSFLTFKLNTAATDVLLFVHRLIQQLVLNNLKKESDIQWLSYCIDVARIAFDYEYGNLTKMTMFVQYAPHVISVLNNVKDVFNEDNDVQKKIAWLYDEIGRGFGYTGKYDAALVWFSKALVIREEVLGKTHSDTATTYHNIGRVYSRKKEYSQALTYYMKALTIRETQPDKNNSTAIAATCNGIAVVYTNEKNYDKALELYSKALEYDMVAVGETHPYTAFTYYNVAKVYYHKKEYEKALMWFNKALSIRKKILGDGHPHTAITYVGIADVYYEQGADIKALELYERALDIDKTLRTGHPDAATIYHKIGEIHHKNGNYDTALKNFDACLVIQGNDENKLPIARTYYSIGCVYHSKEVYDKAVHYYLMALGIQEKNSEHDDAIKTCKTLSEAYYKQGDYAKSLECETKVF
jgi:tetratricopeptide (TPR) repeat protein